MDLALIWDWSPDGFIYTPPCDRWLGETWNGYISLKYINCSSEQLSPRFKILLKILLERIAIPMHLFHWTIEWFLFRVLLIVSHNVDPLNVHSVSEYRLNRGWGLGEMMTTITDNIYPSLNLWHMYYIDQISRHILSSGHVIIL